MATATKAKAATTFDQRLARAQALHAPPIIERLRGRIKQAAAGDLAALVMLADALMVDPRWLATGQQSYASYAAIKAIYFYGAARIVVQDATKAELSRLDAVAAFMEMLAEPRPEPGTCCYCGCTNDFGCGDCTWVDGASTICSTCLTAEA